MTGRAPLDWAGAPGPDDGKPTRIYPDLESWVRELAQVVRRRLGGHLTWCPEWYRHDEAILRLMAMWQEWEIAVSEKRMSNWWLNHCDPHLEVLMSRDNGPFMACTEKEHRPLNPLPLAPHDSRQEQNTVFADPD